jgi:hypothetical protein
MAAPLILSLAHKKFITEDKSQHAEKECVAAILVRCKIPLIQNWLAGAKKMPQLNHLHLSDEERTGHLPRLVDDLVLRLDHAKFSDTRDDAVISPAAIEHGELRRIQGYSLGMLIHESRIFQVTIYEILHENVSRLDFTSLLPDVMVIADEVDSQLTQAVESFTGGVPESEKPQLVKRKD